MPLMRMSRGACSDSMMVEAVDHERPDIRRLCRQFSNRSDRLGGSNCRQNENPTLVSLRPPPVVAMIVGGVALTKNAT